MMIDIFYVRTLCIVVTIIRNILINIFNAPLNWLYICVLNKTRNVENLVCLSTRLIILLVQDHSKFDLSN